MLSRWISTPMVFAEKRTRSEGPASRRCARPSPRRNGGRFGELISGGTCLRSERGPFELEPDDEGPSAREDSRLNCPAGVHCEFCMERQQRRPVKWPLDDLFNPPPSHGSPSYPSEGRLVDHLRMDHPVEVEHEPIPSDVHHSDATYEKARRIVARWRKDHSSWISRTEDRG
jgi:hypothetical protein